MAPQAVLEPRGAGDAVGGDGLTAITPLLNQRIAHRQTMAPDGRAAVDADAGLGEAGDVSGQLLGLFAGPLRRG